MWTLSRIGLTLIVLLLASNELCIAGRLDTVAVRVWDTTRDEKTFPPELKDPDYQVPWLINRASLGVAFSGGGTRSASATLGQLRALQRLGWLDHIQYISANSGGSWTSVPYTYLPKRFDEQRFLGEYIPPEKFSDQSLKPDTVDSMAMSTVIHNAATVDKLFAGFRGDEGYSDIVGSIFLEPFDLYDNEKLFTFHSAALKQILKGNSRLLASDFYTIERENRPYLIVLGTMLAEQLSKKPEDYFPAEMTPLYSGIRQRFSFKKDGETVVVGGGYIESFGYDSYEPEKSAKHGRYTVQLKGKVSRGDNPFSDRYQFTLSDAIGVSSAAPLVTLSGKKIPNLIFPELRHWPVDREAINNAGKDVRRKADEFQHGDGGDIDNLALMPLLVRGVSNVIVFINTAKPFQEPENGCQSISEQTIKDDLVSLFRPSGLLIHNVVIDNGDKELVKLCEVFAQKQKTEQPLTHCQPYQIKSNSRHGIKPYQANICWMYLDRVKSWIKKIDKNAGQLNQKMHNKIRPFDHFPHYRTFAEQGAFLIDLDRERVNALSNLTAWTVFESASEIRQGLKNAGLP
ncbi:MAG: patatin-like phospholipase family protein [Gammaproteobacteria bacterium]|nr:patatin-like phospholipase family protein [Gammaproteobacteria bacterium]